MVGTSLGPAVVEGFFPVVLVIAARRNYTAQGGLEKVIQYLRCSIRILKEPDRQEDNIGSSWTSVQ